jgi:nitrate/TMAO reductase-like tetraheme cytochrome c subunit
MRPATRIAVVIVLAWGVWASPVRAAKPAQAYSEEGAKACLDCHETESVMGILETAHFKDHDPKTPAATHQCQSCHGPSARHMMFPMQVENVHFGRKSGHSAQRQNERCLECHLSDESGHRENWKASAHGYEKVVCSTCHSMHDPEKVVPARADVKATCTSVGCHDTLLANSEPEQYSHALGRNLSGKGELTCSGCHNPHGPLESTRCLDCHSQSPEVLAKQSEKAKRFHDVARAKGTDCVRCHKGIAHPIPPLVLEQSRMEMERMVGD